MRSKRTFERDSTKEFWEREAGWHTYSDTGFRQTIQRQLYGLGWRTTVDFFIEGAMIREGHRVLDLGCGWGRTAIGIKRYVPGATVVGADFLDGILEKARTVAQAELGNGAVTFEKADAHALPFDDRSFDVVVSSRMLQHIHPPIAAVREMLRVLVPGGRVAVAVPNRLNPVLALTYYTRTFTPMELRRTFREVGFEQVRTGSIRFVPAPLSRWSDRSWIRVLEYASKVPLVNQIGAMATVRARKSSTVSSELRT